MHPGKIRVGIVDDHTAVRQGLIAIINSFAECRVVVEAGGGRELIEKLRQLDEPPDICVLDVQMPDMNGYDTLLALRRRYGDMRYLALTMIDEEYSIIKMIQNGVHGYLLKACSSDELRMAITSICTDGYYFSAVASETVFAAVRSHKVQGLTTRELEFLRLCCSERTYNEIAKLMHLSVRTVQDYQRIIGYKLNIHTRIGLAIFAIHAGLIN